MEPTTRWSALDHLDTIQEQAAYLDAALDDGDPGLWQPCWVTSPAFGA